MPISPIVLQRRHAELGRIRLGQKEATRNGKSRPAKLSSFRFTSVSDQYIRDLAELYGGEARPWDNNGIPSWEVITEATKIPVIVVKGGLSQWMETWSGGGCTHRCEGNPGSINVLTDTPCDPGDPAHINAKPTTRLSVMLPELEAIGVFRMETHGWNASAEIPAVAELAQFVGELVPAVLHLVERRTVKDGQTSRFVVPVLDLQIGAAKLREVVQAKSGIGELPAGAAAALDGGRTAIAAPRPDYADLLAQAGNSEDVRNLWRQASHAGHLDDELKALLTNAANAFDNAKPTEQPPTEPDDAPPPPEPDDDGVVEAEVVREPAEVYEEVIREAGKRSLSLWDVESELKRLHDVTPQDATVEQLESLLALIKDGVTA